MKAIHAIWLTLLFLLLLAIGVIATAYEAPWQFRLLCGILMVFVIGLILLTPTPKNDG
jgi:hypothetical protein